MKTWKDYPQPGTRRYRVWLHIPSTAKKPTYAGYVDVVAENAERAFQEAISKSRRTAHPHIPRDQFRLDYVQAL